MLVALLLVFLGPSNLRFNRRKALQGVIPNTADVRCIVGLHLLSLILNAVVQGRGDEETTDPESRGARTTGSITTILQLN